MAKNSKHRKLGRTHEHRRAMLRNLATNLLLNEKVKTTVAKGKEVTSFVERLISRAKKNDLSARRYIEKEIKNPVVKKKMFDVFVARYANRSSGYIRRFRLNNRISDGAEIVLLKLIS